MTFWIHFDAIRIATPPKPSLSPIQKHLNLKPLPEISLAERPFHRVSWAKHMLILSTHKDFNNFASSTTQSTNIPGCYPWGTICWKFVLFPSDHLTHTSLRLLVRVPCLYDISPGLLIRPPVRMLRVLMWIWSFLPETPSHQESRHHLTRNQNLYFKILYRIFNYQQGCA